MKHCNRFVWGRALRACAIVFCAGCNALSPTRKQEISQNWDQQRAKMKLELASAELRNGRPNQARSLALEAVQLAPTEAGNHEVLAQSYIATGDFRTAERILTALVQQQPDAAHAWYLLGTLHEREREWSLVTEEYQRAATAKPDRLDYWTALAQSQAAAGGIALGLQTLESQRARFASEPAWHVAKAELYRRQDDLKHAAESYRAALRLGLDDPGTRKNLGLCLNWLGEHEEAIEHLSRILSGQPAPEPAAACAYLSSLLATNRAKVGLKWLDSAGPTLSVSAPVQFLRAQLLAATRDYEGALKASQMATELDPRLADAHLFSAGLLMRMDRREEALTEMESCLRLQPDNAESWQLYAQMLERFGDRKSAEIARQKAGALARS
jgi:Tfp pilus assembly protein PilF